MYEFFYGLFQNLVNAFRSFFTWVGGLFQGLFEGIRNIFIALLKPVVLFFKGFFYMLGKCFYIVVLVIQVVFGLFKVVGAVTAGAFNTFAQLLNFSGSTGHYYLPGAYQQGWSSVTNFFNSTGFSTIALIMAAFIWLMTAYAVIRIAGGEK